MHQGEAALVSQLQVQVQQLTTEVRQLHEQLQAEQVRAAQDVAALEASIARLLNTNRRLVLRGDRLREQRDLLQHQLEGTDSGEDSEGQDNLAEELPN